MIKSQEYNILKIKIAILNYKSSYSWIVVSLFVNDFIPRNEGNNWFSFLGFPFTPQYCVSCVFIAQLLNWSFNTAYWIFCNVPCQRLMECFCTLLIKTNKTSLRPPVFVITNRCIIVECMTRKRISLFVRTISLHILTY